MRELHRLLDGKMSFAKKRWQARGRIQMPQKAPINSSSSETKPLAGAVALVTGGSRGIGRAIALRLAKLGGSVAICGREERVLAPTKTELKQSGSPVHSQVADVSQSADVITLVNKTQAELGPISILVNNAGIGLFGPAHEKTEADWDRILSTNLKSVFLVSRAVAPSMIKQGAGDIINISSLAGRNAFAGGGIYCASKWGLQGLSACMAEDLREHGIRVSVVSPGSVATAFSTRSSKDPAKVLAPQDVAHAVEMIVTQSPQSFLSEIQLRPVQKP